MTHANADAPIGVFDSGVGGLTVLAALRAALPTERFLYLGDTARVPYGTKSPATVARYAENVADVLLARGAKALVIACNTASAFGLEAVRARTGVPVVDVIGPAAADVAARPGLRRIGVLGTRGTVASMAYPRALERAGATVEIAQQPCPLFVPLAEDGWTSGPVPRQVADTYIGSLLASGPVDAVVLGCTHYPLLREEIDASLLRQMGRHVPVIESGPAAARALVEALDATKLRSARPAGPALTTYLVTDDPAGFSVVGERFLGGSVGAVEHVSVGAA